MEYQAFIEACRRDGQKIERLIRRFYAGLPSRDVLIDGGAHHGYHTGFAREHYSRVVAIEASPKTYAQHLKIQIAAQEKTPGLGELIPLNAALGNRPGQGQTIDFFFSETHPGRSTVNTALWESWGKGEVKYSSAIRVAVVELDDLKTLFACDRRVDFVKLDLEGNEIGALRGATRLMRDDRPAMVMEMGLKPENEALYGETCQGFLDFLSDGGYAPYTPWAEPAGDLFLSGYPFWYLFALPKGNTDLVALLRNSYQASTAE